MADLKDYLNGLRDDQKLMRALDKAFDAAGVNYEKSIVKQLDQILTDMLVNSDGLVRPTIENQRVLERIDRDLFNILESEGLERWQQDFSNVMQRRMETLDRLVKAGGLDGATGIDFQNLEAFEANIRRSLSKIGEASEFTAQQIRDQLLSYKLDMNAGTGPKFSEIRDTLITKAGILPRYAGTVANTTLYSMTRSARIMQTQKAGLNQMKYVGVLDNLTREFCRNHIGVVKTINDWDGTFNEVGPNPASEYGGGWNCRHDLIPWTDEFEVAYNPSHPPAPPRRAPKPKPDKPDAPPPKPKPDPTKPPIVPNNVIEQVDAKLPASFMTEAAVLLERPITTKFRKNARSYHHEYKDLVMMGTHASRGGKASMRTLVHEYGHAIHSRTKILFNGSRFSRTATPETRRWYEDVEPKIQKAFDDWLSKNDLRKLLKTKSGSAQWLWTALDKEFDFISRSSSASGTYNGAFAEVYGKEKARDIAAQMTDLVDMLLGATRGKYGTGHEIGYMQAKGEVEVWAHLWELRHLNYKELSEMKLHGIGDLVKELKGISDEYFDRLIKAKT